MPSEKETHFLLFIPSLCVKMITLGVTTLSKMRNGFPLDLSRSRVDTRVSFEVALMPSGGGSDFDCAAARAQQSPLFTRTVQAVGV